MLLCCSCRAKIARNLRFQILELGFVAAVADLFWEQNHHWNLSNHRQFFKSEKLRVNLRQKFYFEKVAGGVHLLLEGRFIKKHSQLQKFQNHSFRTKFLYLQFQKK